jgi:hypothetical protein
MDGTVDRRMVAFASEGQAHIGRATLTPEQRMKRRRQHDR